MVPLTKLKTPEQRFAYEQGAIEPGWSAKFCCAKSKISAAPGDLLLPRLLSWQVNLVCL
jgi:hypothetical protein